jgi:hypothetical protein
MFVIGGLVVGGKDFSMFKRLSASCDVCIEEIHFSLVLFKETIPSNLVTITFHVDYSLDKLVTIEKAHGCGRLITERFLSLLIYASGERKTGIHQQEVITNTGGSFSTILSPQSTYDVNPQQVTTPPDLLNAHPDDNVFRARFWLRRGFSDRDQLGSFASLMVSLEILNSILLPREQIVSRCPTCNAELGTRSTAPIKQLITEVLGETPQLSDSLWTISISVVAHGNRAVTSDVLSRIVELMLKAIELTFKAIAKVLNLDPEIAPRPSAIVMTSDPYLHAKY